MTKIITLVLILQPSWNSWRKCGQPSWNSWRKCGQPSWNSWRKCGQPSWNSWRAPLIFDGNVLSSAACCSSLTCGHGKWKAKKILVHCSKNSKWPTFLRNTSKIDRLTCSTIKVGSTPIVRRFSFLHNKRNTRFETADFAM